MGRAVKRRDHGLHPGGIRHTEARAEVTRIRHAIQNEKQRFICDGIEKLVKGERLLKHTAHGDDPLMLHTVPRDAVKTLRVRSHRADARGFQLLTHFVHAAVMPAAVHVDLVNRLRVQPEPRRHGVKTREDRFFITSHSIFSFRYQFFFLQSVQSLGSPFQRLGPFRLCTSRRSKSIRRRSTSTPATCTSSGVPRRITSPDALPSRRQSSLL